MESDKYVTWRDAQRNRLERIAQERVAWYRRHYHVSPGNVLEFGCSTGEALAVWHRQGSDCYGLDLSGTAVQVGRNRYPGLRLEMGIDARQFGCAFDLILAFHVVEHIRDIESFITVARAALAPRGAIYIRVPQWASWARRLTGSCWPDYIPEHLHFFTARSMRHWLERHGFEVVALFTVGQIWPWLGGVKRWFTCHRPSTASAAHVLPSQRSINALDIAERITGPLLKLEGWLGAGNELSVIARRTV